MIIYPPQINLPLPARQTKSEDVDPLLFSHVLDHIDAIPEDLQGSHPNLLLDVSDSLEEVGDRILRDGDRLDGGASVGEGGIVSHPAEEAIEDGLASFEKGLVLVLVPAGTVGGGSEEEGRAGPDGGAPDRLGLVSEAGEEDGPGLVEAVEPPVVLSIVYVIAGLVGRMQ